MKIYKPYKIPKPICHICKTVHPKRYVLRVFNQIYVDVVKIKLVSYNKYVYKLILIDGITKARQAYTFKYKGNAFKYITKFIQYVKI